MYTPRSPDLRCTGDTNVYFQAGVNAPMYSVYFVGHMLNITNSPVQNTFAKCKSTTYSNIVNRYMHLPTCVQNLPVSLLWVCPVCQTALWVECIGSGMFSIPPTLRICHCPESQAGSVLIHTSCTGTISSVWCNCTESKLESSVQCSLCSVHCSLCAKDSVS